MTQCVVNALKGLVQPRVWGADDVSAEHFLQGKAGELAGVTHTWLRQAFQRMLRS